MTQVCIRPLKELPKATQDLLWSGAKEAARVWNDCVALFRVAMKERKKWPNQTELQVATKGRYELHSQTVQMVAKSVLVAFANTKKLRRRHPEMRMKYPHRQKYIYALPWPAQAIEVNGNKVTLPMGRGRPNLVLPFSDELPFAAGACKVVWNDGGELHISSKGDEGVVQPPGSERATGDLGEIHQIAVVTSTGKALVVSGRGIRSVKRRRCMELAQLAAKRSRCKSGSRRDKKLARARRKMSQRTRYQVRDMRHKGLKAAINFCVQEKVGSLYVGNPDGVRRRKSGAVHNGRMARWEYGLDLDLIEHKAGKVGIQFAKGTERGTSSHCPVCENKQRPTGRNFTCKKCGATVHRAVMGGVNMHPIGFGQAVPLPTAIKYLRPSEVTLCKSAGNEDPALVSSSRPDTGLPEKIRLLSCGAGESGNGLAKTASNVGVRNQALAENGSSPPRQGRSRARSQAYSESQEATPVHGM